MHIGVDPGEVGVHRASVGCSETVWPLFQGVFLKATIGYLTTILSKPNSYKFSIGDDDVEQLPARKSNDPRRLSDALTLLTSWARVKKPSCLKGPLDRDTMRVFTEEHNLAFEPDIIPEECPDLLKQTRLDGVYYVLTFPDPCEELVYKQARRVMHVLDKTIWYLANLYRIRDSLKERAKKQRELIFTAEEQDAMFSAVAESNFMDDDLSQEDMEAKALASPYGIERANDVEHEKIKPVQIETSCALYPGYDNLNDCIEFAYDIREVLVECREGEKIIAAA